MLTCWMIFCKPFLASGLQMSELQPSFVPLLEGFAIETGATSMKGGNCMICISSLLKSFIPSTLLLQLRCFCFCKVFFQDFWCLLPDTITVYPCTNNPKGQMSVEYHSFFLPQAGGTALSVRQCASLCWRTRVEPLTRRIWLSQLWQHVCGLISCWMGLLWGEKCIISTPVQLTQLGLTVCRAWSPSLPGAVLLKSSALVARGETCCANPLCLSAKSHLSGEVTTASWLLLSCPPSLAVLNPPSFFERSYLHPQICLENLLQDSCEQDCGLPLQQCCSVAEGHSDIHCKLHWAALAGLQHGKKVFPRLQVSPSVDGLGWAACFRTWYAAKESYACSEWCMGVCCPPAAINCLSELFVFLGIIFQSNYSLSPFHTSCRQHAKVLPACLPGTYHQRHELWPRLLQNPAGSSYGPRNPN